MQSVNRVIKFRAWDKRTKRFIENDKDAYNRKDHNLGEFALTSDGRLNFYESEEGGMSVMQAEGIELMQFTGLLDKNGKEIYEGDILRWSYETDNGYSSSKGSKVFSIEYNAPTMEYKTSDGESMWGYLAGEPIEVIGNIYENSELLTT